jgi:hypothetical protein
MLSTKHTVFFLFCNFAAVVSENGIVLHFQCLITFLGDWLHVCGFIYDLLPFIFVTGKLALLYFQ